MGKRKKRKVGDAGVLYPWSRLIRPMDKIIFLSLLLIPSYLVVGSTKFPLATGIMNLLGPGLLGVFAAITGFNLIRKNSLVVWTPFFWLMASIVLYYSLGPLAYVLGSEMMVNYMEYSSEIRVTPADLLRTNLLNAVGIASILLGVRGAHQLYPYVKIRKTGRNLQQMKKLSLWLLGIGGALQFLLILPWEFGLYKFIISGVVYNLGKLFLFGIMTLAYIVGRGKETRWRILFYILWSLQLLVALIHFSKTEMMLTMLLPALGFYMANKSLKPLLLSAIVMITVYILIAQMIHFGRAEINVLAHKNGYATVGQRLDIIKKWVSGEHKSYRFSETKISSRETGWSRLAYSHVQTFSMKRYDRGKPGDTLWAATFVLVPRVIWPNKPIITDLAVDFYELVKGYRGKTHLGLGIFGEGYWNKGWPGVALTAFTTGVMFWFISVFVLSWMTQRRLEYMPAVFLGIHMGLLGTTGLFGSSIVGATGFFVVYALVVAQLFSFVTRVGIKRTS